MNIIYVSALCADKTFESSFGCSSGAPGIQVQNYNRILATGLLRHGENNVYALTVPPATMKNSGKIFFSLKNETDASGIHFTYVKLPLIPKLKNLFAYTGAKIKCRRMIRDYDCNSANSFLILDCLSLSGSSGAIKAAKKRGIKTVGVVTDIPEYLQGKTSSAVFLKQYKKLISLCDSFVYMTEEMDSRIGKGKPYCVIEGQCDEKMAERENSLPNKYEKKVCIYAGGLAIEYGIKNLTDAFCEMMSEDINGKYRDCELWIYGSGDYADDIKSISEKHPYIRYHGVRPNSEVVESEIRATLLINPRSSEGEFTKYSFPSKNLEYMASGTPFLGGKLPGMPKEYHEYIYTMNECSKEEIKSALSEILLLDRETLHKKGAQAKEFVIKNKNNFVQAEKIINMVKRTEKVQ